jgi:hypothetical protein
MSHETNEKCIIMQESSYILAELVKVNSYVLIFSFEIYWVEIIFFQKIIKICSVLSGAL